MSKSDKNALSVEKTSVQQKLLGTFILIIITAIFILLMWVVGKPLLRLASDEHALEAYIQQKGIWGRLAFLEMQVLQGVLPIPIEITTVAGGFIFGPAEGAALTVCAMTISTTLIFWFTRLWGKKLINLFFTPKQQSKFKKFSNEKARNTATALVFAIPGAPKRLFVFSAGLIPQSFFKFLAISLCARLPTVLICSFGGDALVRKQYGMAIALFVLVGVIGTAGYLVYRFIIKPRKQTESNEDEVNTL